MQDFSVVDGFLEVTEDLADMIKHVANEPSVGLFYVQKHIHNATPNLVSVRNKIVEKSHETSLHTDDLEDSLTMVKSMKECGYPIADEMVGEIKKSLSIMSKKQPKKGLLSSPSSVYIGRTNSWSPSTSGRNTFYSPWEGKNTRGYFSEVFKTAKHKIDNIKWPQIELEESEQSKNEKLSFNCSSRVPKADDNPLTTPAGQYDDLSSSQTNDELQEESQLSKSLSYRAMVSLSENYVDFKSDREAKLEEWLGDSGNTEHAT